MCDWCRVEEGEEAVKLNRTDTAGNPIIEINESGGSLTGDSAKLHANGVAIEPGPAVGKNAAGFPKCMYPGEHTDECPKSIGDYNHCEHRGLIQGSCMYQEALHFENGTPMNFKPHPDDNTIGFCEAYKGELHFEPVPGGQRVTQEKVHHGFRTPIYPGVNKEIDSAFRQDGVCATQAPEFRALEHRFKSLEAELRAMRLRAEKAEREWREYQDVMAGLRLKAESERDQLRSSCDAHMKNIRTWMKPGFKSHCTDAMVIMEGRLTEAEAERDAARDILGVLKEYFKKSGMSLQDAMIDTWWKEKMEKK
jgi:hypothetical protein